MKNRMASIIEWWVRMVIRARWGVIFFAMLLTGLSLHYTVNNIKITTDLAGMLSEELPFRQTYLAYKREFPQHIDNIVIVIEGETPEQARAAARTLANHLKQNQEVFKIIHDPNNSAFFDRQALLYMDVSELEQQADTLAEIQPFLGKLTRDQSLRGLLGMLSDALKAVRDGESVNLAPILSRLNEAIEANLNGQRYHVSWQELMVGENSEEDQRRQFIEVQPHLDFSLMLPAENAMLTIRRLAQELDLTATEGQRVRLTGSAALEYEELQSVSQGTGVTAISALVMVLIVLTIGLRSVSLIVATLVTLLVGLVLTAGFATLAIGQLNLISIAFAVLYIGLGVDFAIHVCLRYQELARTGDTTALALPKTARGVGFSLLLCAVTTAVGFYAFIPTAYKGVAELGLISGTGMFISLIVSLTLLPAILSVWPLRTGAGQAAGLRHILKTKLTELPYRYAKSIRWGVLGIALSVVVLLLPQARFDYNPLNLRDPDTESVATIKDLAKTSSRPLLSAILMVSDANAAAEYQARLEALDTVRDTLSLVDFVPDGQDDKLTIIENIALILGPELESSQQQPALSIAQQLQGIETLEFELDSYLKASTDLPWREAVERLENNLDSLQTRVQQSDPASAGNQLLTLEQSLLQYLPESLRLLATSLGATAFAREDLPSDLVSRWISKHGDYAIMIYPQDELSDNEKLRAFVSEIRSVAPDVTNDPILALESGDAIIAAFKQAFGGALIVITLILLLILRNVIDALLVLVPLIFAGLMTIGTLVILGVYLNFANIIALPLLLGMGVDNGIHMIMRMRSTGAGTVNVLQTSTARAVLFSGLTTIVSFGNLSFSSHPGTASMGVVLTLGILITLLSTLIILPALAGMRWRTAKSET